MVKRQESLGPDGATRDERIRKNHGPALEEAATVQATSLILSGNPGAPNYGASRV